LVDIFVATCSICALLTAKFIASPSHFVVIFIHLSLSHSISPGLSSTTTTRNNQNIRYLSLTTQYSLTLALEELGFPTLHTIHMYSYENEEILHMWSELVVQPALEARQPLLGKANLQLIAESGYRAVADLPSCLFFEQILQEYPDCKFILTTRENSEIWFTSWTTLTKSITTSMTFGGWVLPTLRLYSNYLRWAYAFVNKDASYLTAFFPKDDNIKENAIATYEEHNERVRRVIPPTQLLEYSVKDGWEPLCTFLGLDDCPTTPFPKTNTGRSMRAQSQACFWVAVVIVLYLINKVRKSFKTKIVPKMKAQ
jgi:Sulfotransferase domain